MLSKQVLTHTISPTVCLVIAGHPAPSPSFPVTPARTAASLILCYRYFCVWESKLDKDLHTWNTVTDRNMYSWERIYCFYADFSPGRRIVDSVMGNLETQLLLKSCQDSWPRQVIGNRCALYKPLSTGCCFFGHLILAAYTLPREAWFTSSRMLHSANVEFFLLCNT